MTDTPTSSAPKEERKARPEDFNPPRPDLSGYCANCLKTAAQLNLEPGKKLRVCGACNSPRYCGPGCQRAHWKTHKIQCKRYAEPRATEPGLNELAKTMGAWIRENAGHICRAGQNVLLPHKGYLNGQTHLLDTHFVQIFLVPWSDGNLRVVSANLLPVEKLCETYDDAGKPGDFDQTRKEQKRTHSIMASRDGVEIAGSMWFELTCFVSSSTALVNLSLKDPGTIPCITRFRSWMISESDVKDARIAEWDEDWATTFQTLTAIQQKNKTDH